MLPAKKKVTKKKAVKKKTAKRAVKKAAAPAKKIKAIKDAYTKTQLFARISEDTGLARKDIAKVFDSLNDVIEGHVKIRVAG